LWISSSGDGVARVEQKALQDLRYELEKMSKLPSYDRGLNVLQEVAQERAVSPHTIVLAASMLNRLYPLSPNAEQIERIERMVLSVAPERASREEILIENARLSFLCSGGRLNSMACEPYLRLLERGIDILNQSELSHPGRLGLIEVMGKLAETRGSFRGVTALRSAFESVVSQGEIELLTTILGAGVAVGDTPKGLVQNALEVLPKIASDSAAKNVLTAALADQTQNGGSVREFLEAYARIHASWDAPAERRRGMQNYLALVDILRPHQASLHLVTRSHIDQFVRADKSDYADALGAHVRSVEELIRIADDTQKFERADLRAIQSIVAVYPNPTMTEAIRLVLENVGRRVDSPHDVVANLCALATQPEVSSSQWADFKDMLVRQVPKGRAFDGLIAAVRDVTRHAEDAQQGETLWRSFVVISESLGEEVPDLALITHEVLESSLKDPSEKHYRYLTALLNCADVVAEHFNGDCKSAAELVKRLLRRDGLAECLVKAVTHHRKLDLDDGSLYEEYPSLDRALPPLGVSLLHQVVNYQIFHGYPLGEVFRNFSELANAASHSESPDEVWRAAQASIERLGARQAPLDFFGVALSRELTNAPSDGIALDRAEETLRLLHDLSPQRRPAEPGISPRRSSPEEDRKTLQLLAAAADGGVRSVAARVLTMLSKSENVAHERLSCSDVAQVCNTPEQISEQAWIAIGKSIESYRERGYGLERLCKSVFDLDLEIVGDDALRKELWRSIAELMFALREAPVAKGEVGLPYDLLSAQFVERYMNSGEEPQALLVHFLSGMTQFSERLRAVATDLGSHRGAQEHAEVLRKTLNDITHQGFGLTDNPAMVHKLKLILAEGKVDSLQEFYDSLRELKMHALTDIMRNASDPSRKKWASDLMAREFNMGGPPYVQGTEEAKRHFNETMQVVDRAFRDSKGFGGKALDTRGLPRSKRFDPVPPMLVRFGLDSGKTTYIVNSSDNSHFPGKGFYIAGIDAEKVFAADARWRERGKQSPHWRWLENGGLFGSSYFHHFDMAGFSRCGFLELRGLEVVVPPSERRCVLDGVPYSYLVYNRHFAPHPQVALGVPTIVINELLGNSLIDSNDFRGFEPSRSDVSKADFSYRGLLEACRRRKLNLLDLTYGSVIGGGLCNAFLPKSLPHYEWQRTAGAATGWTDSWGHIHKSFRLGQHSSMGRTLDEQLNYARELHYDVMNVIRPLQDYLSAFRFALSFYKMGSTLVRDSDFREVDEDQQEDAQDEQQEDNSNEPQERRVHEYRYRMLQECYRWFHGGREQGWNFEQFPELHFAWVLDPNSLPPQSQRRFHIDLATMALKTQDGTFQLPTDGDGTGEEERALWAEHVVPHFENNSTGWEPRFLMRHGAFSIYE